jgi:hypothetical protein
VTRVLLVSPTAVPGGAEHALARLAALLPANGVEPSAAVLGEGPLVDWLLERGCPTTVVPAGRTRELPATARAVAAIRRLAREQQADAVFSNQSKGHVYGGLAAAAAGLPAVWWQHGIPGTSRFDRAAARVPAAAIACTSGAAAGAQRAVSPRRRIVRISPGTPVAAIAARKGCGASVRGVLGDGGPLVGIVGRLQPWKGQDVFLRAAEEVVRAEPLARFAVVGGPILGWEGPYPDDLRRLAHRLGIADRVVFAGHQDDVVPWFDAMDVVVHASFGEPFGLVVVEAMALGKPVVASADGGPLEIVENGFSGLLVPPGRPEALAAAVVRVLRDPVLAARLSSGATARAGRFDEELTAEQVSQLLLAVTKPARAPVGARAR